METAAAVTAFLIIAIVCAGILSFISEAACNGDTLNGCGLIFILCVILPVILVVFLV